MSLLEILVGLIPEAIYFSLFIIYAKKLNNKRLLFTLIMIFEYFALKCFIKFNMLFQFIYTIMVYINLKVLYKDKAIITDIFVFMIASLILIISSAVTYGIGALFIKDIIISFYVSLVLNRILIFFILYIFRNKLSEFYKIYKFFWNRHRKIKVKIKSLTLRNISIILFNFMFYIINIGMFIAIFCKR